MNDPREFVDIDGDKLLVHEKRISGLRFVAIVPNNGEHTTLEVALSEEQQREVAELLWPVGRPAPQMKREQVLTKAAELVKDLSGDVTVAELLVVADYLLGAGE